MGGSYAGRRVIEVRHRAREDDAWVGLREWSAIAPRSKRKTGASDRIRTQWGARGKVSGLAPKPRGDLRFRAETRRLEHTRWFAAEGGAALRMRGRGVDRIRGSGSPIKIKRRLPLCQGTAGVFIFKFVRQFLTSPSSYPCRLFAGTDAGFSTQRPTGSRNSSPTAYPSFCKGWQ
jgi:hypothetical protein